MYANVSSSERWVQEGVLTLRTAFSRDQDRKVYVQDLLRSDADNIWQLLSEKSAHFYVCGDAKQMASDVHRALIDIAKDKGHLMETDANRFFLQLETSGRYQKDVWIT
jgi:sulfite reductase alpha subunit-like flavoprotein